MPIRRFIKRSIRSSRRASKLKKVPVKKIFSDETIKNINTYFDKSQDTLKKSSKLNWRIDPSEKEALAKYLRIGKKARTKSSFAKRTVRRAKRKVEKTKDKFFRSVGKTAIKHGKRAVKRGTKKFFKGYGRGLTRDLGKIGEEYGAATTKFAIAGGGVGAGYFFAKRKRKSKNRVKRKR